MAEFTYEVTERIAVLSTNARGWERQLNMVRMAKGISLTEEELKTLKDILNDMEL